MNSRDWMSKRFIILMALALAAGFVRAQEPFSSLKMATVPPMETSVSNAGLGTHDSISFVNGDTLYGHLRGLDGKHTVQWLHADAKQPMEFKLESISTIDFP